MSKDEFEIKLKVWKNEWNVPQDIIEIIRQNHDAFPTGAWSSWFDYSYFDGEFIRTKALSTPQ